VNILGTALKGAKSQVNLVGAPSFAQVNPYGLHKHYKSDEYASHYPNVRPIVNEFMQIVPYAVNSNGKPVKHAVIDALHHPNRRDSLPLFLEKLGVSVLAQDYTFLLVWRRENGEAKPGGNLGVGGKNIAGFTFLECPAIEYRDGRLYYKIGAQEFNEDEVIAIPGGVKPGDLYGGYSPYLAAAQWASLDRHIADFQNGFFQNNAIPAGVFKIAAPTTTEFDDIVDKLQERHQGAGNNNNVSYTHVPLDENGAAAPAQIEWVPFAQTNREIDFKPLLEHVDNRLSEAYGVSSIIKGVDSNAKYSNAEVSEAGFAKRAVKPLPLRIYSQITHELNRITGGLGAAITFKYEIPTVSDAEKVKAETKQIESEIILKYTSDPYNWSLDSVVDAFQLSNSYKLLKKGNGAAKIDNDKPEVDEGGEVANSPDPSKIDGVTPLNKAEYERHCAKCDRFLGLTSNKDYADRDKCSNSSCKALDVPVLKDAETSI
jgi:phage portal protein BeeE